MKRAFCLFILSALLTSSCVSVDYTLGSNLLPYEQNYYVDTITLDLQEIYLSMADSLSGFDDNHIVVGAVADEQGRVSSRSCALTIVPLHDSLDFGQDPHLNRFHMSFAYDTISVKSESDKHMLQSIGVYELKSAIKPSKDYDCNKPLPHSDKKICAGTPLVGGTDSLSFDFTEEYAKKFFALTQDDLKDWDTYTAKIPGIFFEPDKPVKTGGRINLFDLQLSYDSSYGLTGNFAELAFSSTYDGVLKDTSFFFYMGPLEFVDIDSLITNTTSGVNYPQYALNFTDEEAFRPEVGKASETIRLCGGGGPKPRISAAYVKKALRDAISRKGGDPDQVLINKATLVLPFEMTENRDEMYLYPGVLGPATKIKSDTTATFMSITDNSSSTEDVGLINRAFRSYEPDISYHIQSLIKLSDTKVATGDYDIWLLLMRYNTTVTDTSDSELAEMYEMLAYQSYYNQMYGGYSSSSYSSYSNYYSYMMMAQYAASSTSTDTSLDLDRDFYYQGFLHGPTWSDPTSRPRLIVTYSHPRNIQ